MKRIAPLFFILAAGSWYAQKYPSLETWSITFLEWNQKLPIPMWSIFVALGIFLSFGKKKTQATTASKAPIPPPLKTVPQKPKEPNQETKTPTQETKASGEWKENLSKNALALSFPRGGKVALDPQKDTPFILKLPHKTHQAYKDSIHIFAQWLASTPTPKRLIIRFDAGCSEKEQQLVRAAFRKHYHINEMIIRKEANQIDILFHHPDQKWGRKYNLNKDFQ